MEDVQTKLAIEALKSAGCGVLAIHVESRTISLEQDNQEQCRLNAMGAEREARLMARVKELEKDAVRYRWLRTQENNTNAPRIDVVYWIENGDVNSGEGLRLNDLDAAIDNAMQKD